MAASLELSPSTFIVPEPKRGTIVVEGPDAKTWLQGILTCDVAKVTEQDGAVGLLLNKTGKIQTDLYTIEGEGRLYLSVAGAAAELAQSLDRFLVMEDTELSERSAEFQWFLLYGAQALESAKSLAAKSSGVAGRLEPWADVAALVVQRDRAEAVLQEATGVGVQLATDETARVLRLERGLFEFGVDFSANDNPHEAALERRAVSWTKGCYLGQEVVCMQDMRGKLKRRLATLLVESGPAPAPGSAVMALDEQVGEVTSSAPGQRVLAAARLKSPHFEPGTALSIAGIPARIVETRASG